MMEDEQLQASAKQVKFLQNKSKTKIASPDSINDSDFSLALLKLKAGGLHMNCFSEMY
jgi:hypothetical protein